MPEPARPAGGTSETGNDRRCHAAHHLRRWMGRTRWVTHGGEGSGPSRSECNAGQRLLEHALGLLDRPFRQHATVRTHDDGPAEWSTPLPHLAARAPPALQVTGWNMGRRIHTYADQRPVHLDPSLRCLPSICSKPAFARSRIDRRTVRVDTPHTFARALALGVLLPFSSAASASARRVSFAVGCRLCRHAHFIARLLMFMLRAYLARQDRTSPKMASAVEEKPRTRSAWFPTANDRADRRIRSRVEINIRMQVR